MIRLMQAFAKALRFQRINASAGMVRPPVLFIYLVVPSTAELSCSLLHRATSYDATAMAKRTCSFVRGVCRAGKYRCMYGTVKVESVSK
jgi:hypothetical protein